MNIDVFDLFIEYKEDKFLHGRFLILYPNFLTIDIVSFESLSNSIVSFIGQRSEFCFNQNGSAFCVAGTSIPSIRLFDAKFVSNFHK